MNHATHASSATPATPATPAARADPVAAEAARQLARSALWGLLALMLLMQVALWTGTPPHPPADKGPVLAAISALFLFTLELLRLRHAGPAIAMVPSIAAGLLAFGPHKFWTEAQAPLIAPVIVLGSVLIAVLAICAWRLRRA